MNTHVRYTRRVVGQHDLSEKLLRTKAQIVKDMVSAEIQSMTLISVSRLQLT